MKMMKMGQRHAAVLVVLPAKAQQRGLRRCWD